jgi:hypothetical protein
VPLAAAEYLLGLPASPGIYLHSKGVKRRQLELLSRLGLVCSYHTITATIKKRTDQAAVEVAAKGQEPTVVTAYDNFEQMEHVREQRVDNENSFHSVTTGQLIQGIEMPAGGLQRSMLDSNICLYPTDIFNSPGNQYDYLEAKVRAVLRCTFVRWLMTRNSRFC